MRRLRISAISYLNTAPLMWDFDHGEAAKDFDIFYSVPSSCAAALREGTGDIGIIPAIAYNSIPGLVIIPEVAIAARGPVRSILLISKVPREKIRTIATDNSSMTSVALTRVLFHKWWGAGREFRSLPPDLPVMLGQCDAALIIGDPALKMDRSRYQVLDLAEEWRRLSGQSFVFAFWAVRQAALEEMRPGLDLAAIFQASRDHGLQPAALEQIGREWSARLGITPAEVQDYLTRNIYYQLDRDCLEGMDLFFQYAAECGAVEQVRPLDFLPPVAALSSRRRA
ncbi:MAG TPA: menaquinone biosynthesis protein [Terriglobales bacterium]|nr:menaquinone biosynthesis protein [Terriglobales bacterium]